MGRLRMLVECGLKITKPAADLHLLLATDFSLISEYNKPVPAQVSHVCDFLN